MTPKLPSIGIAAFLCPILLLAAQPTIFGDPEQLSNINVDIYSGFSMTGGGAPYTGLFGSFASPTVSFASDTGYNWHPFNLSDFGANITGTIQVSQAGTYILSLNSDDGSLLFVDGNLVIDNGGPHGPQTVGAPLSLSAGNHSFEIQFFECCGGASGVDFNIKLKNDNGKTAPAPCIQVNVYRSYTFGGGGAPFSDLAGTLNVSSVSFATDTAYAWHPFGLFEFGADMNGLLTVASAATYSFGLDADDGAQLFIDGNLVTDDGNAHGPQIATGTVFLTPGKHQFEVQFFECCGGASGVDLILPDGVNYACSEPCHLTVPADLVVCNDPGQCGAIVSYPAPILSGDCEGLVISCSPPAGSLFPAGTTTVTCSAADGLGNVVASASFHVTVKDCEAPFVDCVAGVNPAGKLSRTPGANPNGNPDGFYQLIAVDNCDGTNLQIVIKDSAEGPNGGLFQAGPFANGAFVKLTQSPGTASVKAMTGAVIAQVNTRGNPLLVVTDSSGNTTVHQCQLPPSKK